MIRIIHINCICRTEKWTHVYFVIMIPLLMADKDDDGWDISSSASPDCSPLLGLTCNRRKSPISSLFLDWGQSCSVLWQLWGLMGNFKPGQQLVLWKLQLTAQHPVFNRIKLSRRVSRKKKHYESGNEGLSKAVSFLKCFSVLWRFRKKSTFNRNFTEGL